MQFSIIYSNSKNIDPKFESSFASKASNLTNGPHLHQFLVTKSAEVNKSVKTDANGAH